MIDGHRGDAVAKFLHKHLIDCIKRNEAMMVKHHFSVGLKQVFLKLEEAIQSELGQKEMRYLLGWPRA